MASTPDWTEGLRQIVLELGGTPWLLPKVGRLTEHEARMVHTRHCWGSAEGSAKADQSADFLRGRGH